MSKATCVNLRELFGDVYRIKFEESYYTERTRNTIDDPWLQIIPGKYGHIYPHGDDLLAVATEGRGIVHRLLRIPGVDVVQDGSDGVNATFPVESFQSVADLIRARKRKIISPEQRARLVAMGTANLAKVNAGAKQTAPESTISVLDD